MMSQRNSTLILAAVAALAGSSALHAQVVVNEDFTVNANINPWYAFNGACLTASTVAGASSGTAGAIPGCVANQSSAYGGNAAQGTYYNEYLVGGYAGAAAYSEQLPDPSGHGALRLTNGPTLTGGSYVGGYNQNGAIISSVPFSSSAGVEVQFISVTYRGDSRTANPGTGDGADGMSFFLMDASVAPNFGSYGGSLGYTCSNNNPDYHGMIGAYLGLGIDEYGNFLNGINNTLGTTGTNPALQGDNTASGGGYQPNRIGLRGAGNINWKWLNANYSSYYPGGTALTAAQQNAAVQNTCKTGTLWDYSAPASPSNTGTAVLDYQAIPNAYKVISSVKIGNEYATGGYARSSATPILYDLKITPSGLLSLKYKLNGGSWTGVITNQSISNSQPGVTTPSNFLFGFAGSTGGASNIHEILCFKATPTNASSSSASSNEKQSAQLQPNSTQAYFAYYNPDDWTGALTANSLGFNASGNLVVNSPAVWDAACVLTGVPAGGTCARTGQSGLISAQAPASRTMLTWSGTTGIPLEFSNITSNEQNAIDAGDTLPYNANRLLYLRGDRSNEVLPTGAGLFRDRDSVLGDIIDSSPAWVGPPESPYTQTWKDRLYGLTGMPENSGAQTYASYVTAEQSRLNVVYVGSDDGLLHGFAAGSQTAAGLLVNSVATPNNGQEVLAYMPQTVLNAIHSASTPDIDYANPQYAHAYYVDATPGSGDLFYSGAWHTWLVGGLGAGGSAIYALDVTNPSPANFVEGNAANLVIGEWTPSSIACTNAAGCGSSMGNTYGTPQVRRLHNGTWGIIFGNGLGSASGDAGIFIITFNPTTLAQTTYYLSTGQAAGAGDGIAAVTPVDLDGDHITDYVYAGDLNGNVWRFDLTSNNASNWAASTAPLFTAAGQPITTQLVVADVTTIQSLPQVMVAFGTGQKKPLTTTSDVTYASGTQNIYAFWDWNLTTWNGNSGAKYASLTAANTGLGSPYTLTPASLTLQGVTVAANNDRDINAAVNICWRGTSTCGGGAAGNNKFGWYIALPGNAEQIIYNPELISQAFVVNSIVPAGNSAFTCTTATDTGYTYAISMITGGAISSFFPQYTDTNAAGVQTNATGSSFVAGGTNGGTTTEWLVYQTVSGTPQTTQINPPNNISGSRLTWVELR
jgi:type IV pilus assembly protein PilY1